MSLLNSIPRHVRVVEVGPRDGLQNESTPVSTGDKVRFVDLLTEAGLPVVEVTSFVNPKAVPQLADATEVLAGVRRRPGVRYPVLVPNLRGLERAIEAGATEIAVFTAASETFNLRNINMTIEQSIDAIRQVIGRARPSARWIRGYVSTCFGCPYEGPVDPARVVDVAHRLIDLGVEEVSIGDTIGVATPNQVEAVVAALVDQIPIDRLALHFHDTRGTALANVLTGLQLGVAVFDSSAGGLGGCPFAPGASGNLATEDLVYLLHGLGVETGVDLNRVVTATEFISRALGHPPASRYFASARPRDRGYPPMLPA